MKWLVIAFPLVVLLMVVPTLAADPGSGTSGYTVGISPGEVTPTPEMWFYEQQLRQYQDPKAAVRKQAEFKTAQRKQRLAARRWFGFSNARPTASADPYHGDYSPHWSSPSGRYPFQWTGIGSSVVVISPKSKSKSTY